MNGLDENIVIFWFLYGKGASNSLSGKDVKLSERLYLPSSKLRGFESGKIGPKDGEDHVGGNYAACNQYSNNSSPGITQLTKY